MNRKNFIKGIGISVVAPSILFAACKNDKDVSTSNEVKVQTYTCPMHPQIVQNKPGNCPICGMDLVLFDKTNTEESLTLDASQQALANITTTAIGISAFSNSIRLNGRIATNPEQTTFLSSRVPGRIEVLYIKETGVPVRKGQPLYKIYSEQLSTLQQEYLIALAQSASFPNDNSFKEIVAGAKQKLLLYGQTEQQLNSVANSRQVSPYITYYAQVSGVVAELSVTEGQYVPEGGTIMRLEEYGNVWVEADVYPSEENKVQIGQQVKVIIPGYEDQSQIMTIRFITPALQTGSQLMQIRGDIPNPNNQWQPGMQAVVLLPSTTKKSSLTLPVDAVIREGGGTHVWVEKEKGKFFPRLVTTEQETSEIVEIKSGLEEGEIVVITGAYLLYSEFILKKGKHPLVALKS